jgi:PAS domain S-box-containing protein
MDSHEARMSARRLKAITVVTIVSLNMFVMSLSWFSLVKSKQQSFKTAAITAQNLAQVLEQNITGIINKADIGIIGLAQEVERQIAAGGVNEKKLGDYLVSAQRHFPELHGLRVVNAQGKLYYSNKSDSATSINVSDREYFIHLRDNLQDNLEVSKPFKGRIDGKWVIAIGRRVNNPDGTFAGVAFGTITLDTIDRLFSSLDVGKYGAFALRDGTDLGLVARYPEPDAVGSNVGHKKMSKEFLDLLDKGEVSGTYNAPSGLDKRMRTWGFRKFGNNRYYVFVGLAHEEILAEWRREAANIGVFAGMFSLITIVAGRFIFLGWQRNRATEEARRVNDERMRLFFERQIVGMAISDANKHWTQMNDKWCEVLGYTREELEKLTWEELTYSDDLPMNLELFNQIVNGAIDNYTITKRFIRKDGVIVVVDLSTGCVRNEDGTFNCLLTLMEDVTDRKAIEELLIQLKESVDNSTDAIGMATPEGKHYYENRAFTKMFGKFGDNPPDLFVDNNIAHEMFREVMSGGNWSGEVKMYDKDKRVLDILLRSYANKDSNGRIIGLVGIHTDITERKLADEERGQLEKQLLHAQKLESLGVLAGGIAHDFNNILMAIIGNADLALLRINKESPATENLHRIEQAAARAADLAKQMLAYSGKGKFVIDNIDINHLLEDMLHMLEVSISKKAVLRLNSYNALPQVEADATQLRQIIMNLVINASEAIGDKSGVIAITTGCMDCDKSYLKDVWLEENLTEGLYVYLEIADTGCGMDKDILAKIFDPFFTTKFTGRGLGMAAVLGIVRGHKGAIKVYSEPNKGTTFKILLPASNRPVEIFNGVTLNVDWKSSGTVLLVDDEETVRGVGKEMLQELGFSTITANDGREAIDIFKATPNIAFVILDLTMPHVDGEQCYRELKKISPEIKVIMSSGFNEQEVTQKFAGKGLAGFIQKPYKVSVLMETIQKIY